jgi:hypothetical protein
MKCRLLCTLVYIMLLNTLCGQNYIDLVRLDYALSPQNSFESNNAKTDLQEVYGDFTLPIVFNDHFNFLTGAIYENRSTSLNPGSAAVSVTALTLKVGANINHNSEWSGTYMLLPKIASDLEEISNSDFQFGAVALMKHTKNSHLNYKFGAYFNRELFGNFLVPMLGLYYLNPSDKLEVKVLLPMSGDINYKMAPQMRLGLNFTGQIRSYNLNTPIGDEKSRYVARSTNEVVTYFQYELKNGINIQPGIGRSIARSYRIYDEQVDFGLPLLYFGDNRTQLNTDFSDGWIFKVSTFYRLKL